jgi:DNA-binding NarL/FixJ family response regulator
MSIKIVLADDHKLIRDGLRHFLESEQQMEVLAETDNGRDAVRLAAELEPDVVILDVSMPDMNGIEAARQINSGRSRTKVMALSMHSDRRFVARMFQAGAAAYLVKDTAIEEVADAIRTVIDGKMYLSPQITGTVIDDYVQHMTGGTSSSPLPLTSREQEVLQLIAEGNSTREIAAILCLSGKTVDTHRRQIMDKLDIHSIAELTKYAVREGLTTIDA